MAKDFLNYLITNKSLAMDEIVIQRILKYGKSNPRNKIIFFFENMNGLRKINLGRKVSELIYNLEDSDRLALHVSNNLNSLLDLAIQDHDIFGKYLCIENPGILLEPELKLNFATFLGSYSQNNLLFVQWDGEIDDNSLYFLTKGSGVKINIKHLSHIVI